MVNPFILGKLAEQTKTDREFLETVLKSKLWGVPVGGTLPALAQGSMDDALQTGYITFVDMRPMPAPSNPPIPGVPAGTFIPYRLFVISQLGRARLKELQERAAIDGKLNA